MFFYGLSLSLLSIFVLFSLNHGFSRRLCGTPGGKNKNQSTFCLAAVNVTCILTHPPVSAYPDPWQPQPRGILLSFVSRCLIDANPINRRSSLSHSFSLSPSIFSHQTSRVFVGLIKRLVYSI